MAVLFQNLIENLHKWKHQQQTFSIVVGFDGYIDRIQKVVQKKVNDQNLYFNSIDNFSKHVSTLAGRSGQIELSLQETKIGGNAPIMASAIAGLGLGCCCMGTMGWPKAEAVFEELNDKVEVISLAPPAQTDAYEFNDGKIIFSECSTFTNLTWVYIKEVVGLQILKEKIFGADLFAAVDWVNLPWCSSIWQGILEEIIAPAGKTNKHFFFDLADPSRKSPADILEVLEIISGYNDFGYVTLGLNETEAREVYAALTGTREVAFSLPLEDIGALIFKDINVTTLMIHPVDRILLFNQDGKQHLAGRVVNKPKILTGGGDNLNAGFCLGLLLNLPVAQVMLLAMATSGAYVQNGQSPSVEDLIEYLENWKNEVKVKE